jgi:transposase
MQIRTIGIDLAKNVFQVHGVDTAGKVALAKKLRVRRCWRCSRSWHLA